jgi:ribosomal protein S18 acetylase RimI-like enzyme
VRDRDAVVAERDGGIVGLVVLVVEDGELWVDNVAVDPGQQGTGVGRALLEHAESEAAEQGFDSVVLLTHELMSENLAFYQRIGYRERERRPPGEGYLVVMEKPVAGSAT